MSAEQEEVTVMILNVDLKCSSCYMKVRKLLCKFPQIRDQVFDEEKNKVRITVVCCDPERVRDKLCCKGGRAIQSIEILEPPKPKPKPKPQPKPQSPPMPKPDPQNKPAPEPVKTPDPKPQPVKMPDPVPQPQPVPVPVPVPVKMPDPKPQPQPQPQPVNMPMDPCCPPVPVCCQECYQGRGGGPCHYAYGRPPCCPPASVCCQECYQGRGGGPCHYAYRRPPCYATRCDCDYFSEENPQGCSIM